MAHVGRISAAAVAALLFLGAPTAPTATVAEPLPALVSPWPAGLSGTVVFESDVAGRPGIYTLDLAQGRVARLTGAPGYSEQTPRWSPDGRRVVFTSNRAHYVGSSPDTGTPDFDVWSIAADGSDARRLTREPSNDNDPAWTADGARVVFSSDRDSRGDLYELRLDTGATTRLTRHFVGRGVLVALQTLHLRDETAAACFQRDELFELGVGGKTTVPVAGANIVETIAHQSGVEHL